MDKTDLDLLERLLSSASSVVSMREIYEGASEPDVIGLRHDVDHDLETAVKISEWEAERGYRSTYFILHTAHEYYFDKEFLVEGLEQIAANGHEIGIHNNAITEALTTHRDPARILIEAIEELRGYGFDITGTVAHGDSLCRVAHYVNDEMFLECPRPEYGDPDRELELGGYICKLEPRSLADFMLDYDSNWLHRKYYLSDTGGRFNTPREEIEDLTNRLPNLDRQLHVLWHPCWWRDVFNPSFS